MHIYIYIYINVTIYTARLISEANGIKLDSALKTIHAPTTYVLHNTVHYINASLSCSIRFLKHNLLNIHVAAVCMYWTNADYRLVHSIVEIQTCDPYIFILLLLLYQAQFFNKIWLLLYIANGIFKNTNTILVPSSIPFVYSSHHV
jgi:hypothetical protein